MEQRRNGWIFLVAVVVLSGALWAKGGAFSWGKGGDEVAFFDDASEKIEQRVADGKFPALDAVYKELFYAPLWVKAGGLSPFGSALMDVIGGDETVTPPVNVHEKYLAARKAIEALRDRQGGSLADKVALEMTLTRLYLTYARYRIYGGIDWAPFKAKLKDLTEKYKVKVGWETYPPKISPATLLNDALSDGDLARAFDDAEPTRFGYRQLKQHLIRYIRISRAGGWPKLPGFKTIRPGQSRPKVIPAIRKHLKLTGDLQRCDTPMDSPKYDKCLVDAVKRFQLRHGLKGDGVIGPGARKALNMTVTEAIQKIRLNLDRIKYLSRKESPMRIELNIPSFRLNFFNHDKLVTTIRVVVGKPDHPTPSFHNKMKYIVVNPWWKIPESIVKTEMLPKLIRDPYHYEAQGKELHASYDETSKRIDPGTINWAQYRDKNKHIPYYFMQVPSRHNALGKIKFLFPNGYSVYIHDTPSKSLFFRSQRAFSHGCMRIQKPRELLESLALFNDNIDVDGVMKRLEGTEKQTIVLNRPVPIDITYLTAFIDPYGYLNFRRDIYRYDRYQLKNYTPKCRPLTGTKRLRPSKPARPATVKKTSPQPDSRPAARPSDTEHAAPITRADEEDAMRLPERSPAKKVDRNGYEVIEIYDN